MATWMTHFRVAGELIDFFGRDKLDLESFVFGNIAPDCGVPNPDGKTYTPDKDISHYGKSHYRDYDAFRMRYLSKYVGKRATSFYYGYYCHLIVDEVWSNTLLYPKIDEFLKDGEDRHSLIMDMKVDWRLADDLFLKENGDFEPYRIILGMDGFENEYLEFFPKDAFDIQLKRLKTFYSEVDGAREEYKYLGKSDLDEFVIKAAREVTERFCRESICGLER